MRRRIQLFVSVLAVLVSAQAAFAEYQCEDIPDFEMQLRDLKDRCGAPAPAPGVCRARGYMGATVREVIAACSGPGTPYNAAECGADLKCPSSISYCSARGYVGDSPAQAVAACSGSGTPYNSGECGAALTCNGNFGFFRARGYVGDTAAAAVVACSGSGTPYNSQECSADVKCVGSAYFCQNWNKSRLNRQLFEGERAL